MKLLNSKSSSTCNHHSVKKIYIAPITILSSIPHPSFAKHNISYGLNKSLSNCGKQRDNTADNRINFDSIMNDITHGQRFNIETFVMLTGTLRGFWSF